MARRLVCAWLFVVDGSVLSLLRPQWRELTVGLEAPHLWIEHVGTDGAAAVLAGAALWSIAAWLALGIFCTVLSTAPGLLGVLTDRLSRRVLPSAVRSLVTVSAAGAVGAGIVLTPTGALAAGLPVGSASHGPAAGSVAPAWPSDLDSPSTGAAPTPAAPTPAAPTPAMTAGPGTNTRNPESPDRTATTDVLVRPGDCLWVIAARRLGPSATDAEIAVEWPRWFLANRSTVGPDPSLIKPGELLRPPVSEGK